MHVDVRQDEISPDVFQRSYGHTIHWRYVPTRTAEIPAMHQELQAEKRKNVSICVDAATRCSRAVRTGYHEWRIAGQDAPILFKKRETYVLAMMQDRAFDK